MNDVERLDAAPATPVSEVPRRPGFAQTAMRLGHQRRSGFTLVECLATMLLMAIVLPVVNQGLANTTSSASATRRRTEAAGLAQSKLSELIVTGNWQSTALKGDCGSDWPDYQWNAALSNWTDGSQNVTLQQLDVNVTWTARGRAESVTVSGLVYARPAASE